MLWYVCVSDISLSKTYETKICSNFKTNEYFLVTNTCIATQQSSVIETIAITTEYRIVPLL